MAVSSGKHRKTGVYGSVEERMFEPVSEDVLDGALGQVEMTNFLVLLAVALADRFF